MSLVVKEDYMNAYMAGYVAAMEKHNKGEEKPYLDVDDIMKRYDVGRDKAGQIIRSIRTMCGGGMLPHASKVKRSEVEYWDTLVDKKFTPRL